MRIIRLLITSFILLFYSVPLLAWQVTLQAEGNQVQVSNEESLTTVDIYLTWFDKDATTVENQFVSWTLTQGWQPVLIPVATESLDVSAFEMDIQEPLEQTCPSEHRCFLALVAVTGGADPVDSTTWQKVSMLPLSTAAAQDRMPGQQVFLPVSENGDDTNGRGDTIASGGDLIAPESTAIDADQKTTDTPAAAPTIESDDGATPETEKPDIFKLADHQVLYANGSAERFQVIDVADPKKPQIVDELSLAGNPREVYTLNEYNVLLQSDSNNAYREGQTIVTVLNKDQNGQLTKTSEITLTGNFSQSRRRNQLIYVVTQTYQVIPLADAQPDECGYIPQESKTIMTVHVLRLEENGQLTQVDALELPGYAPVVAIFPNHLVTASHETWPNTQIQVFDLSSTEDPLIALPGIEVPGEVPSEFHLNVSDQFLYVVYGNAGFRLEEEESGSTFAIYDLNRLSTGEPISKIGNIAPEERLHGVRFSDDHVFIVTYKNVDPVWVIDISDPQNPQIIDELGDIPGWSEKLFFYEGHLLGVGTHDQPEPDEPEDSRVRRLALSLFDVADPTQIKLLDRRVPFVNQPVAERPYGSDSMAVWDERALFLDWEAGFIALPANSWGSESGHYAYMVEMLNAQSVRAQPYTQLSEFCVAKSPVALQRVIALDLPGVWIGLGDQTLLTFQCPQGEVLGQIELATNINWLDTYQGDLLAGVSGGWQNSWGYYRLQRHTQTNLANPIQSWTVDKAYGNVQVAGNKAVFFDVYYPLAIQVVDLATGQVDPAQQLEEMPARDEVPIPVDDVVKEPELLEEETNITSTEDNTSAKESESTTAEISARTSEPTFAPIIWYGRSQPITQDNLFCVGEQQGIEPPVFILEERALAESVQSEEKPVDVDPYVPQQPQWVLRCWDLTTYQELPQRTIPGSPVAFTSAGHLITQEYLENGQLRLNLLTLEATQASLLHSRELAACERYNAQMWPVGDALYLSCTHQIVYLDTPVATIEPASEGASETKEDTRGDSSDNAVAIDSDEPIDGTVICPTFAPPTETEPTADTLIFKLNPEQQFAEEGQWTFSGYRQLTAVSSEDTILLSGTEQVVRDDIAIEKLVSPYGYYYSEAICEVYQLTVPAESTLLTTMATYCPWREQVMLTPEAAYIARGFAGIEKSSW